MLVAVAANLLQLLLSQARTTHYWESFFYRSSLLWNSLPKDIQAHRTNSTTFRNSKAIEQHWLAQSLLYRIWVLNVAGTFTQQQSSSSSRNRFIEHKVSTRKLGPFSGIHPGFLKSPICTFTILMVHCVGVTMHRPKLF